MKLDEKLIACKSSSVSVSARYLAGLYASERGSGYGWDTDHYGTCDWVLRGAVNGPYIVYHRIEDSSAAIAITLFVHTQ